MFYRLKDNKIYDYADYEYADDCLVTKICSMKEFEENRENFVVNNGELVSLLNKDDFLFKKRKNEFESAFFCTSLGWIRRKVTMQDGSIKDFLSDLLLPIRAGMEMGQTVEIIVYRTPDFSEELNAEYLKSLQEIKAATPDFIQECLFQTVKDFRGGEDGDKNGI